MANANVWTDQQAGTGSYTAGGFVITTTLSSLASFIVRLGGAGANLGHVSFDIALNSPAAGQATVKVMRENFDRLTAVGSPSSLPAGVTAPATSKLCTTATPLTVRVPSKVAAHLTTNVPSNVAAVVTVRITEATLLVNLLMFFNYVRRNNNCL